MRTHYSNEITPDIEGTSVEICGWVHEKRDLGKIKFIILRDRTGYMQVTFKKGASPDDIIEKFNGLSRESVISIKGKVKAMKNAPRGVEIIPDELNLLSPAHSPLPLDPTKKVDAELDTRLDNRFMDLRKPDISAIFKIRDKILTAGREFFESNNFIEIHSPKIIASASEGGTELFPISYFDKEAFLAQSPQLYKQMMMATGFDRVYEVTSYFRAEEHDTRRHLNEITAFDSEMAFIKSEEDVMQIVEGVMRSVINRACECSEYLEAVGRTIEAPGSKPFRRVTYDNALEMLGAEGKNIPWGEDIDTEGEKLLGKLIKEKFNEDLFFITKYPLKIKPFYTMPDDIDDPELKYSRAFDLEYKGTEICSGSQRLHIYDLLVERLKFWKLNPDNFKSYLDAFRFGMPPHGGFGLGIDRIMMQLLDMNVREVVLFPRDRHRLTP